jgi:hypothetical protein
MSQLPGAGTVAKVLNGPLGSGTVVIGGNAYAARAVGGEIEADAFALVVGQEDGCLLVRALYADQQAGMHETPWPIAGGEISPHSSWARSLRRALRAGRWSLKAAEATPGAAGGLLLLLLPFIVLVALLGDLLVLLFGGGGRATLSLTALFALLGFVLGRGGEGVIVLPIAMGMVGLFVGGLLWLLFGSTLRELREEHFDQDLSAS